MTLATYSDLKSAIATWMDRTDLTAAIPDFITLFEATANAEIPLRTRFNLGTTTLSTVAGQATVHLPSDFLEAKALINQTSPVTVLAPYTAAALYGQVDFPAQVGPPAGFTYVGEGLELAPVPDAVYALKLYYYRKVTPLSDAQPSNWLLTNFPNLYLFGALVAAEAYMGADPRVQLWRDLYEGLAQKLAAANERGQYGGAPLAVRSDCVA
jgi:hypothetical protein